MPSQIALILCILFILYIFFLDSRNNPDISYAHWISLIWTMILGTKNVAEWLNVRGGMGAAEARVSGNPIDQCVYSILIVAGLFILSRRKIHWQWIFKKNAWIFSLFLYCGVSILWSDFPVAIFRKWIKSSGDYIMALVVLSDVHPIENLKKIIRRCGYILIPMSILLIKYFPNLGMKYSGWSGTPLYVGVTTNKNTLGMLCLICGYFFFGDLLFLLHDQKRSIKKKELFVNILLLLMILWLLIKSNSATSLLCLIIGICITIGLGFSFIKKNVKFIVSYISIVVIIVAILQLTINIGEVIVSNLGRDMTFTGRTSLWKDVIAMNEDPLIGSGYESFWLGNRLLKIWEKHPWEPNQAHNGYIEVYINLGLIGLLLLIIVFISVFRKIFKTLLIDFDYGRFQLGYLIIYLIHNITEASFKGFTLQWFVFLLVVMEIPR